MQKNVLLVFLMALAAGSHASCFNASEVAAQAASPFASAPLLEKAVMQGAADAGWNADQESANGAAYFIIGKIGTAANDSVQTCIGPNNNGDLSYQVFTVQQGRDSAGFMPLQGTQK